MKKTFEKKLILARETIKNLSEKDVAHVAGASVQSECWGSCVPGLCLPK
jgi:hypothetical protein